MTDVRSPAVGAEPCRGLGALPSPLWGGVGGGGPSVGHRSRFTAPPPFPPLPQPAAGLPASGKSRSAQTPASRGLSGGGSRPSLLRATSPEREGRQSND